MSLDMKMRRAAEMFQAGKILLSAPGSERSKIWRVLSLYRRMDREVARFRRQTGLRCLPACGHCCESPQVEATPLELLPLAVDLWKKGLAEEFLQKINRSAEVSRCVFYKEEIPAGMAGHCTVYSLRPAVCRLFGFSVITNKLGEKQLVTCQRIKEETATLYTRACQAVDQGFPVPRMSDFSRQIGYVDLALGWDRMPINEAFKVALERVGFLFMMKGRKFL